MLFVLSHSYHRARSRRECGQGPAPPRLLPGYGHAVRDQGQTIHWAVGVDLGFVEVFTDW